MTPPDSLLSFCPRSVLEKYNSAELMARYFEALRIENKKINLVSRETIDRGLEVLAAESLLPFDHINRRNFETYLDIGSGGGFPAIPVLLALDVAEAILLERNQKKSLALGRIMRAINLEPSSVDIRSSTFEECRFGQKFDLITLRQVSLTGRILRRIEPILADGGHFVYYFRPEEKLSLKGFSSTSYCYHADNEAHRKHFTIIKKKL